MLEPFVSPAASSASYVPSPKQSILPVLNMACDRMENGIVRNMEVETEDEDDGEIESDGEPQRPEDIRPSPKQRTVVDNRQPQQTKKKKKVKVEPSRRSNRDRQAPEQYEAMTATELNRKIRGQSTSSNGRTQDSKVRRGGRQRQRVQIYEAEPAGELNKRLREGTERSDACSSLERTRINHRLDVEPTRKRKRKPIPMAPDKMYINEQTLVRQTTSGNESVESTIRSSGRARSAPTLFEAGTATELNRELRAQLKSKQKIHYSEALEPQSTIHTSRFGRNVVKAKEYVAESASVLNNKLRHGK